jgi:hypothetical protein
VAAVMRFLKNDWVIISLLFLAALGWHLANLWRDRCCPDPAAHVEQEQPADVPTHRERRGLSRGLLRDRR